MIPKIQTRDPASSNDPRDLQRVGKPVDSCLLTRTLDRGIKILECCTPAQVRITCLAGKLHTLPSFLHNFSISVRYLSSESKKEYKKGELK
jgi:hypothetical protein